MTNDPRRPPGLFRQRRKAGKVVLPIVVNEDDVAWMLIRAGILSPEDVDDRTAITAALERQIEVLAWCEE